MAKYLATVRYGLMMSTENFQSDVEGLGKDLEVIVQTDRGVEIGEIASEVTRLDREVKGLGEIIRLVTEHDRGIIKHIREVKEPEEVSYCQQRIQERNLAMRLVGVEHLFSSDKVVFYFVADGRVDFRGLVRDLARRYRTRIEMRQIGVRDESRLLADYGHCGRELCCRTFIRNMEPVTMRMAKTQKTTLDPAKISGHCGRLMCCLRFEDKVYGQLRKELPSRGTRVTVAGKEGRVVDQNLLREQVVVEFPGGDRESVAVSEVSETNPRRKGPPRKDRDASGPADSGDRSQEKDDSTGETASEGS